MQNCIKLFFILLFLASCSQEEEPSAPAQNQGIVGLWEYESIRVEDSLETPYANDKMEPGQYKGSLGGERAEINRRRIRYYADGTYQLLWLDRGAYELGTEGEPNWQPSFGFYLGNSSGDSLYHNRNLYYQCSYSIRLENNQLIRESKRYMSTNSSTYNSAPYHGLWRRGNEVKFVEVFRRIE